MRLRQRISTRKTIKADALSENITQQGQIKGFIAFNANGTPLTQANYDALPASKETDGYVYLIRG